MQCVLCKFHRFGRTKLGLKPGTNSQKVFICPRFGRTKLGLKLPKDEVDLRPTLCFGRTKLGLKPGPSSGEGLAKRGFGRTKLGLKQL